MPSLRPFAWRYARFTVRGCHGPSGAVTEVPRTALAIRRCRWQLLVNVSPAPLHGLELPGTGSSRPMFGIAGTHPAGVCRSVRYASFGR